MRSNKTYKIVPAWILVAALVALGAGTTSWCFTPPPAYYSPCGDPCAKPTIDIDQENFGNGHLRDNFADAEINYTGASYFASFRGGEIDVDQDNVGYGHERNNIGYATIDNGGGPSHGWGNFRAGEIDIDQDNYGNGNSRDNAAFATWAW